MSKLTLKAPMATKVVCFSRLLKCLRSVYSKQCGPRSDCSYRSSLIWVHAVCFYILLVSNVRQLFAADDFRRRHFQMHFFLGSLRVKLSQSFVPILSQPAILDHKFCSDTGICRLPISSSFKLTFSPISRNHFPSSVVKSWHARIAESST